MSKPSQSRFPHLVTTEATPTLSRISVVKSAEVPALSEKQGEATNHFVPMSKCIVKVFLVVFCLHDVLLLSSFRNHPSTPNLKISYMT
uniref:Putative ovule protein n=1 Tax=Solanum chacoense TaxID=4108 RepID=A0A0V0GTC3_SOLCH